MGIRKILSRILGFLSKWAIRKHGMKIIVIAGRHGTKITGELLSEVLSLDHVVRRQLERPFWDFSVPLSILGFDDRTYSRIEWLSLIVRSVVRLLISPANFTWTILQMNTNMKEIAEYWARLLEPEMSVFVNVSPGPRDLEELIMKRTKHCIIVPHSLSEFGSKHAKKGARVYSYGNVEGSDVRIDTVRQVDRGMRIVGHCKDGDAPFEVEAFQTGEFMVKPLIATITALQAFGLSIDDVVRKIPRVQIDPHRFPFSENEQNEEHR